MTRFVVLHHTDWPGHRDHFDLMLQVHESPNDNHETLVTYSTVENILPDVGIKLVRANRHRQAYLNYEGPISGERGQVKRVDEGVCKVYGDALKIGDLKVELTGQRLRGIFTVRLIDDFVYILERFT